MAPTVTVCCLRAGQLFEALKSAIDHSFVRNSPERRTLRASIRRVDRSGIMSKRQSCIIVTFLKR